MKLITRPPSLVRRAMLCHKCIAAVLRGKLRAIVESHFHRGRVSLNQNVRSGDPVFQIGTLSTMMGVLMVAEVVPRPPEEGAVLDPGDEIRDKIIAEPVALVDRAPKVACLRMNSQADAVAQPACKYPPIFSVRIEDQNRGSVAIAIPTGAKAVRTPPARRGDHAQVCSPFRIVVSRADRNEHPTPVLGK